MALFFDKEELSKEDSVHRGEWQVVLAFIQAKQTEHEQFKVLFNRIVEDAGHAYYTQANTIKMLYDFTPLDKPEEER